MRYAALACLIGVASCASPTVQYSVPGPAGNTEGLAVRTLPRAWIVISADAAEPQTKQNPASGGAGGGGGGARGGGSHAPHAPSPAPAPHTTTEPETPQNGGDPPDEPSFSVVLEDDPQVVYLVRPHDSALSTTMLSSKYREHSTVPESTAVQTVDHREELAQDVASIISAFGDPTFLAAAAADNGQPEPPSCLLIRPEYIQGLLATAATRHAQVDGHDVDTSRESIAGDAPKMAGEAPCSMVIGFGPVTADAVRRDYFDANLLNTDSHFWISAVCRSMEITYRQGEQVVARKILYVPDSNFIRLSPLPNKGTLDQSDACSAPSVDTGDAEAPATTLHVISSALDPFRNGGGGGGGGGATDDTDKPNTHGGGH